MKITFDNVLERVVNNRTISRKEKQNELRKFLKEHSGANKPTSEKDLSILETLKAAKQTYSLQDANEKAKDNAPRVY
ncbi:MAG: hypothetical protein K2X86_05945 [Cytophagaceae bacterium]|nr:hypothetical protein [Cytophagaceae bacterium]